MGARSEVYNLDMFFIVTVDTEADNQWKSEAELSLSNLAELPRFQDLCEDYSYRPTYLVTYEVADNAEAAQFFKKMHEQNRAEIGAHLHPWTTPPFSKEDERVQRFPGELPTNLLRAKLTNLTGVIKDAIGVRPRSFRAGRWGFNKKVARILAEAGYRVDTSITPKVDWGARIRNKDNHTEIPNFSTESVYPHMLAETLLEVPMTIVNTGLYSNETSSSSRWLSATKIGRALSRPRWCRIFGNTTLSDLKKVYYSARKNNLPALVFMTHSSELIPGNPYVKTYKDQTRLYALLEQFLVFLREEGVPESTLLEFYKIYQNQHEAM